MFKYAANLALGYLKTLQLDKATSDAVALTQKVGGKDKLVFGFRGTAQLSDLVPDAQLALNA